MSEIPTLYLITNKLFPDAVKIGRTRRPLEKRARELNSAGVPGENVMRCWWHVDNEVAAEALIHKSFEKFRQDSKKEWFLIPWYLAISLITQELERNGFHVAGRFFDSDDTRSEFFARNLESVKGLLKHMRSRLVHMKGLAQESKSEAQRMNKSVVKGLFRRGEIVLLNEQVRQIEEASASVLSCIERLKLIKDRLETSPKAEICFIEVREIQIDFERASSRFCL